MTQLINNPETVAGTPNIHMPPDEILAALTRLTLAEETEADGKLMKGLAKQALADAAMTEHTLAVMLSQETGESVAIPSAVVCPNIVGAEVIYGMTQERRHARRGLVPHPDDPTRHLITPL